MKYVISLNGCDDTTKIEVDLTDEELNTIIKVGKIVNETSKYGCMPTMSIYTEYRIEEDAYIYIKDYEKDLLKEDK
jgi:hypothetical protein